MTTRLFVILLATLAINGVAARSVPAAESALTTYGERNPLAPDELKAFSFLVGKWAGTGQARLQDGKQLQFELTWIGRYVLDGMAIADEGHSLGPGGKPYLGITLRQFDSKQRSWIIEFLNVTNSFLRRQVNPRSGSVIQEGSSLIVISHDAQTRIRERYRVTDQNHFSYGMDTSHDAGRSWDPVSVEMTMTRVE